MKPRVIGLNGFIGVGKTAVATILQKEHGYERLRFAGPLKSMLKALGCTDAELDGDKKESPCELLCGATPRRAMQTLGTEWGRGLIGQEIWAKAWLLATEGKPFIVADDLRFLNEANVVRALEGKVWRIERPGVGMSSHTSESQEIHCDALIYNEGDLGLLSHQVAELVEAFS